MIEHKCSLSDYHLIILESCPEEELESKEQYYINKFKSEYFGFNQLNLKTLFPAYIHHNKLNDLNLYKKYIEIFKTNCDGIIKYFNWGYTKFNYEYAFPTKTDISRISKDESRKMLCELISCIDSVNEYIDSPFYSRKNEISKVEDIIQQISERKKLSKEMRQILFPLNNFDIYSLKDRMYQQKFDNNYIRFVLSNNGKSKISDIIKIDYKLNGLYNEFYIGNKTTINSSMVEYGEKDIYNRDSMQFKRHFFNIIPKNFKFHIIKPRIETEAETARFISVVSEYKTGINDFTLYNKKFVGLDEAMLNIIEQIKPDTKINVMCSESKTLLTDLLTRELSIKTQNKIKKKILVFNLQI